MRYAADRHEDEIVRAYVCGLSEKATADRFGFSRNVIRRLLLKNGVAPRGRSEAELLKWSQMTPAQRERQVRNAHVAATGRIRSLTEQSKIAQTRERHITHVSPMEIQLMDMLKPHGFEPIQQKAIGPYNCDLAIGSVAVEVWGGHWHWYGNHRLGVEKRFRYILNAGWHIYVVPISTNDPLTESRVCDLVTYLNAVSGDPSAPRKYRVVWSAGEWEVAGTLKDDKIRFDPPFTYGNHSATGQYQRRAR